MKPSNTRRFTEQTLAIILFHCSVVLGQEAPPSIVARAEKQPQGAGYSFDPKAYQGDLSRLPIGVFDSGIGGLTVLEALLASDLHDNKTGAPVPDGVADFHHERFIYFGDQANMPYGNYGSVGKTNFLRELIVRDALFLIGNAYYPDFESLQPAFDKLPVKGIVIACNTATAFGLDDIRVALSRWKVSIPVVGVIEAGGRAVLDEVRDDPTSGTVAIMATTGTCDSQAYPRTIARLAGQQGVRAPTMIQQGSAGLAGAIEGSSADPHQVDEQVRQDVSSLVENYRLQGGKTPIKTVVLGCTHFPLVTDKIVHALAAMRELPGTDGRANHSLIAEKITVVNPAQDVAKELYRTLRLAKQLVQEDSPCLLERHQFYLSTVSPAAAADATRADRSGFLHEYKYRRTVEDLLRNEFRIVPLQSDPRNEVLLSIWREKLPAVSALIPSVSRP
jgi:glutamate racemase